MRNLTKIKWKNIRNQYKFSEYGHLWSNEKNALLPIHYDNNFVPFVNLDNKNINIRNLLKESFNKNKENFEWVPISRYGKNYLISEYGHVWSHLSKRLLKFSQNKDGYYYLKLSYNGIGKIKSVHTLVLENFHGPRPTNLIARHYPSPNKKYIHYTNLIWGTFQENSYDRLKDSNHYMVKLSEEDVINIKKDLMKSNLTQNIIADKYNISYQTVSGIAQKRGWKHIRPDILKNYNGTRKNLSYEDVSKIKLMIRLNYNKVTICNYFDISNSIWKGIKFNQYYTHVKESNDVSFLSNVKIIPLRRLSTKEKHEITDLKKTKRYTIEEIAKHYQVSEYAVRYVK